MTKRRMTNIEQPKLPAGRPKGIPNYYAGGKRSQEVMKALGYDPIKELVETHKTLQKQLDFHEKVKQGIFVPLAASGRPIRYNANAHNECLAMLIKVGESLLRYKYGRVPEETSNADKEPGALVINLSKDIATYKSLEKEAIDAEMDKEDG